MTIKEILSALKDWCERTFVKKSDSELLEINIHPSEATIDSDFEEIFGESIGKLLSKGYAYYSDEENYRDYYFAISGNTISESEGDEIIKFDDSETIYSIVAYKHDETDPETGETISVDTISAVSSEPRCLFEKGSGVNSVQQKGTGAVASGVYAVATGNHTTASGNWSHAEGFKSTASTEVAHSEGYNTSASGIWSHAEGDRAKSSGKSSHAEGSQTTAAGEASHTEGVSTTALGIGSHAEGVSTTASSNYSHAEGKGNTVSANAAHAEGSDNTVNDDAISSHVGGNQSSTNAKFSFAHGNYATTGPGADSSFALGAGVKTSNAAEFSIGRYNKSNTNTRFSVGIGTASSDLGRKNAFEVMQNGDAYLVGLNSGGYNGTNAGGTGVSTLQTVINNLLSGLQPATQPMIYDLDCINDSNQQYYYFPQDLLHKQIITIHGQYAPQSGTLHIENNTFTFYYWEPESASEGAFSLNYSTGAISSSQETEIITGTSFKIGIDGNTNKLYLTWEYQ